MIDLPKVGQTCTWQEILTIAKSRGMADVVAVLANPPPELPFKSDGCSGGCPQSWNGVPISHHCVEHDIRYWCGLPGDDTARLEADLILARQVEDTTNDKLFAYAMFTGVRVGGGEGWSKSYSWGFGRK